MASESPEAVIIGLGYVGLPLAREMAMTGMVCHGLDVSERAVTGLNAGRSHIDDISDDDVRAMLDAGFAATTDPSCLAVAETVVICVPTPLQGDHTPDLDYVYAATRAVSTHLHEGMLVVLESTTYPGTTDGPVRAILEESGLTAGVDFHLAFSPERIDPGNPTYGVRNTPKVIGGFTPACTDRAVAFYSRFIDEVVPTVGTREAELAKLLENTYRHVNIALVNEMAVFCNDLGIDLWASIDAAKTKPFGFQAFYPGPGVGGHCIPIDPNYLSYSVRSLGYPFRFVELAQEVSGRMPSYVVARIQLALNDLGLPVRGTNLLVLGVAYKPNISDTRETPATPIIRRLRDLGATVLAADPHVRQFAVDDVAVELELDLDAAAAAADMVVLLQPHAEFDLERLVSNSKHFFDTRGLVRGANVTRL
jgi:UDP-N-acetyl-D-glucosamine dehydrogenase